MHFYTYKITNLINGKIYIGVHKTTNLEDGYMGSGVLLHKAFSKYGIENFKKDIIEFHESSEEMFLHESKLVNQEFLDRTDTYNIRLGGKGGWDHIKLSNTERIKLCSLGGSAAAKNRLDPEIDIKYRETMSVSVKSAWDSGKYDGKMDHLKTVWIGRNHKPETVEKIKETLSEIAHQQGSKNSQFGKMWIHSLEERKSTRINKNEPIPDGWKKGRKMFKN